MTLEEKITQIEKNLDELSKPPVEIEDTHVAIAIETCEKHGQYECRTRTYPNSLIKIPPRSSICPGCLTDELIRLQGEKIRNDEAARKRNIDLLLDGLSIPARFENCTLQNYEPVNDDAKRALKVCQAYASRWPERLQKGGGLVMCGNPDTNKQDFVRYRVSGNSIVEGSPTKAKKFELLYIRNRFQANERALRECRRLIYSRMTMSITAMADGEWVNIGDMVQVPDTYDTNQQAGYIVAKNGNDFETSERINFSGQMFVQITDYLGATTARYPASPRPDTQFGFTAAVPNIELNLFDGFDVQSPSRYVIATSEELDYGQWTITGKQPDGKGNTALTLAEYSDKIYQ